MLRKLVLATILSFPLAILASGGSLSGVARAQGGPPGDCYTNYSSNSIGPFYISDCSYYDPGGSIVDGYSIGTHWVGTTSSANYPCAVPSIVTGQMYVTNASSELEQPAGNTLQIIEQCSVQTNDTPGPGHNLFAYNEDGCYAQQSTEFSNSLIDPGQGFLYVTENATGLASIKCVFTETINECSLIIKTSLATGSHNGGTGARIGNKIAIC